jgi:hypothetical protein
MSFRFGHKKSLHPNLKKTKNLDLSPNADSMNQDTKDCFQSNLPAPPGLSLFLWVFSVFFMSFLAFSAVSSSVSF